MISHNNIMGNQELLLQFAQALKIKHYAPRSMQSIWYCAKRFIDWVEREQKSLKEISKQDIVEYGVFLKQKDFSPNSTQRYLHSVKRFFSWQEESYYILVNPMDTFTIGRVPRTIPVVLTEKEVMRVIEQPNVSTHIGIRDRALLEVLYSTGIRLNELHNLSIFDIDTQEGFLRVTKGKGSKDRFTPLTKAACSWLKTYLTEVRPHYTKHNQREQALFVGICGKRINAQIINHLVQGYAQKAGIHKRVTVHTFRHTFATHMVDNDVDIFKVQKLLGHSHPSITQIYVKVSPQKIKEEHAQCHPREQIHD